MGTCLPSGVGLSSWLPHQELTPPYSFSSKRFDVSGRGPRYLELPIIFKVFEENKNFTIAISFGFVCLFVCLLACFVFERGFHYVASLELAM